VVVTKETPMRELDRASFEKYVREQWAKNGVDVGEETDAPYREKVSLSDGWAFGLSVFRDGVKARAGIWFRPAVEGKQASIHDLAPLRNHYQQTLQKQNRFVRIANCGTEFGTLFMFWEATQPLPQEKWQPWVQLVEELNQHCFDSDALDMFLEGFR
jgi:hypothetical protein